MALEPVVTVIAVLEEHAVNADPAATVIILLMFSVFVEVTAVHGAFPFAVSVNVTLPAVISAALGLYVQVVNELAFAKVPVPLEVQAIVV